MSIRAHRTTFLLATAAACLVAGAAQAQNAAPGAPGRTEGLRYMSWSGRPASTTPADVSAAQARAHNGMIPRRIAPSQAVSRPTMQAVAPVQPVSRGLTPASAWLNALPMGFFAPGSPDPLGYTREMMAPAPQPVQAPPQALTPTYTPQPAPQQIVQSAPAPTMSEPRPEYLPDQGAPVAMISPTPQYQPQPAPVSTAVDPNAPRADALIFRLRPQGPTQPQQPTAEAAPQPQTYAAAAPPTTMTQPGQPGSRYYSVHRENGRTPDRTTLPEAVYYDSVALNPNMTSEDLSVPPQNDLPQRDAQGRRVAPARDEDPERP